MATITISNTGGNWNATGTWVGGVVPGATDDVVATATSGNLTVTANASLLSLNFTSYVSTFTVNTGITLTINGNLTLSTGMTTSGTGILSFNPAATAPTPNTATLTSNGKTWTGSLTFATGVAKTIIFGDPWTIGGNLNFSPASNGVTTTFNSNSVSVRGNITVSISNRVFVATGTTVFIAAPLASTTCTISTPNTSGLAALRNPLTLNGAGSIVFSLSLFYLELQNLTWTAGSVSMTADSELRFAVASILSLNGIDPLSGTIRFNGSVTYTISNAFTVSGALAFGTPLANVNPVINGSTITVTGNVIGTTNASMTLSGTSTINVTGSSSLVTMGVGTLGRFGLNLTINSSGTVTFSGSQRYGGATTVFTYVSGTIVYSLGISSATWTSTTAGTTYTMNGTGFSFPGFIASTANTFSGTEGCSFYSYTCTTAGITHTFAANETYTITNGLTLTGTSASRNSFVSSVPNTQAIVTVQQGATIDVGYTNATDIDSSLGQTVWSYRGTLLRTNNWQQLPTQPRTVAHFNI
jgi:hypothetical protein